MPEVVIVGADGTEHVFPDGFDPKKAAAIVRGGTPLSSEPGRDDPIDYVGATLGNIPKSAGRVVADTADFLKNAVTQPHKLPNVLDIAPGIIEHYSSRYGSPEARERTVRDDPVGMVFDLIPARAAVSAAPTAAKATAAGARRAAASTAGFVSRHPTAVSTMTGATPGIMSGNLPVALGGAALGFERAPALGRRFGRIEKRLRGDSPRPSAAPAPLSGVEALQREVLSRDIDWRTTDAVPIDAIKRDLSRGGSIIEAGESRVGLAERMAEALKTQRGGVPTPEQIAEAIRLATALRQRMHISAKTRGGVK